MPTDSSSSSNAGAIRFVNRYTQKIECEKVLGDRALRWVYGTALGRLSLHALIKRAFFSQILGYLKNRPESKKDIAPFVEAFGINLQEAQKSLSEFTSFNDFFYRKLREGARPLCADGCVALPADARHSAWQNVAEMQGVFVKGQRFDLPALLGSADLAEQYAEGTVVLSRLCPVDYHRFHFPVAGRVAAAQLIPGSLASVSPYSLRGNLSFLWTNKRELTRLQSDSVGEVLILAVGATGVGSIFQTYRAGEQVAMGEEQGYFAFGGSTIMTFFLPGKVELSKDLRENTAKGLETFARQGDVLGRAGSVTAA